LFSTVASHWQHRSRRARLAARATLVVLALITPLAACGREAPPVDLAFVDDFGNSLRVTGPVTRIVSLNPVTTELLFAIGAGDRLVGRTTWDLYSDEVRAVADVGPGMQPNVEAVLATRPQLVLLYASESNRLAAQQLRVAGVMTIAFRTDKVADLARITPVIARAVGLEDAGKATVDSVTASLDAVRAMPRGEPPVRAFWHLWDAPLMTIGGGSFLSELLVIAGAENSFGDIAAPSPQITLEEVARRDPDVILSSPRAAERIRNSPAWRSVRAVREGRVLEVDTNLVGRPGVRMGEAARSLRALLAPVAPR
jgi:iron complex transport system substrate-binding protein